MYILFAHQITPVFSSSSCHAVWPCALNHNLQQVVLIVWTLAEQFIDPPPPPSPVSESVCVKNNPSREGGEGGGVLKLISDGILFGAGAAG